MLMLFIDHNDLFVQWQRKADLKKLQTTSNFYDIKISETKKELADLQNNPAALEKYARENYSFKRDNEDVFIVETPKSTDPAKK